VVFRHKFIGPYEIVIAYQNKNLFIQRIQLFEECNGRIQTMSIDNAHCMQYIAQNNNGINIRLCLDIFKKGQGEFFKQQ
jgi:hypothetical protein